MNRYVDILEQTFLLRKLAPFVVNVGRRLVKSPKVYFRDTGLLHYFLGIDSVDRLQAHPARGASWEAFVIEHLLSAFERPAPGCRPYFWRTAQGDEVDLVIDHGRRQVLFEVKLHSSPRMDDARGLVKCMETLRIPHGYLVYPGPERYSLGRGVTALPAGPLLAHPEGVARL